MIFDLETLIKTGGYLGLFAIVFAESGLLFGFFLPGDSLLFTAGFLASQGFLDIALVVLLVFVAAVIANSGLSCCSSTTTENGINVTCAKAEVYKIVPRAPESKDTPVMDHHCLGLSFLNWRQEITINGIKSPRPTTCSQNTTTLAGKLYSWRRNRPSILHNSAANTTAMAPVYRCFIFLIFLSTANGRLPLNGIPTVRSAHDFHMIMSLLTSDSTAITSDWRIARHPGFNC